MRVLFILMALLFSSIAQAEIVVYNTYEDFLKDKGEVFESFGGSMHVMSVITLFVYDKNEKKSSIKCDRVWGFKYNGHLFRTDGAGQFAMLVEKGKICYYENGTAHLEMIRQNSNTGKFKLGFECYFSDNLNSELYVCPLGMAITSRNFKKFKSKSPQHFNLFACIGEGGRTLELVRKCAAEYNKN